MTTSASNLDCILIGPHEVDFDKVEQNTRTMGEDSGAYRVLKTNSVRFRGRRMPYFGMLNQIMEEATGRPSNLHVCELPSLALCHLKTWLHRAGFTTAEINFFPRGKEYLTDLLAADPLAVAITTTFYVDNDAVAEVVRFVRENSRGDVKIIVGGPHIMNVCKNYDEPSQDFIFATIGADFYICDSQGEDSLARLLGELREQDKAHVNQVPNLIYTNGDGKFHRTLRVIEDNPIEHSIVDWSLFPPDFYTPTVQLRTARSCSFACSFCQYPTLGGPLSLNSIETVEAQLKQLAEAGVQNVVFIDDTFNVPFPRFKKLCKMIINNGFDFNWFSFFRCANSDDEAFDLMAESGCKGVFLGIESGDNTVLKNMNKSASAEKYRRGIGKLNERGILSMASLIVGFPGETKETITNTMNFIEETAPTFYRAELYYHYTGVPIHQRAGEFGIKGTGYHWKHNTMHWEEAASWAETMYRTIGSSLVMPSYMFDFWSIPYLLGSGMSVDRLKEFMRLAQTAMLQDI
jgi:p-methyltransferase